MIQGRMNSINRWYILARKFNKAVRDRIPEIIEKTGKKCKVISLPDEKYLVEMQKKLLEEAKEYLENRSEDELVDILEVVYRISELMGIKYSDLEKIRKNKTASRGAFTKNYFLIETS